MPKLDHIAEPEDVPFAWVPQVRRCRHCRRYLRRSTTSPSGWRHSGLNP